MYTVTRQLQYYEGNMMVEISEGGFDYVNPDMLSPIFEGEGETFSNPIDAVDAAISIRDKWQHIEPDNKITIGYGNTLGFCMAFEPAEIKELKEWSQKEYESLPKCDRCGDIIKEEFTIWDMEDMKFCSENCAENAYSDMIESMEE